MTFATRIPAVRKLVCAVLLAAFTLPVAAVALDFPDPVLQGLLQRGTLGQRSFGVEAPASVFGPPVRLASGTDFAFAFDFRFLRLDLRAPPCSFFFGVTERIGFGGLEQIVLRRGVG